MIEHRAEASPRFEARGPEEDAYRPNDVAAATRTATSIAEEAKPIATAKRMEDMPA